jgi:hypothetical protein
MLAFDAQLTANEVLRAFHHDEPFLFLGAAFNTVTIILIGLCVNRRKAVAPPSRHPTRNVRAP